MGLFSFLTPKSGADTTSDAKPGADGAPVDASKPADVAPVAPPSGSAAGGDERTAADAADAETPFTPPGEWNLGALTAPIPQSGDQVQVGPPDPALTAELQGPIVEVLKTVYDPEIPVDIYELGLIYDIVVDANRHAMIKMTLTSPACPSAQQLPSEVKYKVKAVEGVTDATVDVVWDPPWDKDRMSEAAKLQLGFF